MLEIPKGARKKTLDKNQHLSELNSTFRNFQHPSESPSPFGMCCEVPENFSAERLNRGKYECADEAARTIAAVRTI